MTPPTPTLVNIGTHSLALYTHGPSPTSPDSPVIFYIPGIGSSQLVWAPIIRMLPILPSYTYDRSGYNNSQLSPRDPTAENIALELSLLITRAPITNPLVIVGHSWAGIIVRELLAIVGMEEKIQGLVLVDANHERGLDVLNVVDVDLELVFESEAPYRDMGLEAGHKMTKEEWESFVNDENTEKYRLQAKKEEAEYAKSFETLKKKRLGRDGPMLGNKPVFVVGGFRSRDWWGLFEAGVERGNGTAKQRKYVQEMIRGADEKHVDLIREHLKLSTCGEIMFGDKSGHFVQLTEPEIVVDGIKWVLDNLRCNYYMDKKILI